MSVTDQHSTKSLTKYGSARSIGEDRYRDTSSRDFCNSFWGPGDDGVNVLFSRMRGAAKTTDELKNFWNERAAIEEQYATRLATLAKSTLGSDETGELRNSLETLRLETEKQATAHYELGVQIRTQLDAPTSLHHAKQINHRRNVQAAVEKKFKTKQSQESYVSKAREKYETDCIRIASYTQQSNSVQGKDLERLQAKLKRAQQTVQANEKDFSTFTQALLDILPGWEADWKEFCDSCQDLEEERVDFMKDIMWAYANEVSTLCVSDDQSCERIREALDQLEPERDVENFIRDYGTGNAIPEPQAFVPFNGKDVPTISTSSRPAQFIRASRRPAPAYQRPQVDQRQQESSSRLEVQTHIQVNGTHNPSSPHTQTNGSIWSEQGQAGSTNQPWAGPQDVPPPPQPTTPTSRPPSGPLPPRPVPPEHPPLPQPPVPPPTEVTGSILFYVKALYDYTATIEEEFDFQAGDVIAVTATPDDGWWSGELLDEARREQGRHIFPSNFVCLF